MMRTVSCCILWSFLVAGFSQGVHQVVVNQDKRPRIVPAMLNYQGYLTDTLGIPIDDSLNMTFSVFDQVMNGTLLWTENMNDVLVERGVFSVLLGSVNPIPDTVFTGGTERWLEMTVEGQTLAPRTRITAMGYAFTAVYADTAEYARNAITDNDWVRGTPDSVLFTAHYLGIARGAAGNMLYGDSVHTHANLGVACTTGTSGQNAFYCIVSGGYNNIASANFSFIGGGYNNSAAGLEAFIGGGKDNTANSRAAFIGGGIGNSGNSICGTIGGGNNNLVSSLNSTVGGGGANTASGDNSVVSGGWCNAAIDNFSTVAGGYADTVKACFGGILSGFSNLAGDEPEDSAALVIGGMNNSAIAKYSYIGAGQDNFVAGDYSAILGGYADTITATANYSYLFGINSKLTKDSTFMIDMPHIRFGDERDGYSFPYEDGESQQVLISDGSGQLIWTDGSFWSNWSVTDSVLYTNKFWGIARGDAGNILYGNSTHTHINLGVACTTGMSGQNLTYTTISGGHRNVAIGRCATVAGGIRNTAGGWEATVGGGGYNSASDDYTTIAGGRINTASNLYATVGGGTYNIASGYHATVIGGAFNTASGADATVGGGKDNFVAGEYSAILGGYANTITATADYSYLFGINSTLTQDSTFMINIPHIRFGNETSGYEFPIEDGNSEQVLTSDGSGQLSWTDASLWSHWSVTDSVLYTNDFWGIARGGADNMLHGDSAYTHVNLGIACTTGINGQNLSYATISGGYRNMAIESYTTIAGGYKNTVMAIYGGVLSGYSNLAGDEPEDTAAVVVGGRNNKVKHKYSFIGGGSYNIADTSWTYVGGGRSNTASGEYATMVGGDHNTASGNEAFVGGGDRNIALAYRAVVCGGSGNTAANWNAFVGGGGGNSVHSRGGTVAGGNFDTVYAHCGGILSGRFNLAGDQLSDTTAVVVGGSKNAAYSMYTFVGGGEYNKADSAYAFVGGGCNNTAGGSYATVSGGDHNTASGECATVAGGYYNAASADFATVAGGWQDTASAEYAIVLGGYRNIASADFATVAGGILNTADGEYSFVFGRHANANSVSDIAVFDWGFDTGTMIIGLDGFSTSYRLYVAGYIYSFDTYTCSDRDFNTNIRTIDDPLAIVNRMHPVRFRWREGFEEFGIEGGRDDIGFIGQDLQAVLPEFVREGADEHHLAVNYDHITAVNTAAIQELTRIVNELKAENKALKQRIDKLEK